MPESLSVLLVSPDLMVASRIAPLCREAGATLETRAGIGAVAAEATADLVLVDLQALSGPPAEAVARARGIGRPGNADGCPAVVAFGPHVAEELLEQARAAGADDVVSRGQLLGGFAGLLGRHCGGGRQLRRPPASENRDRRSES